MRLAPLPRGPALSVQARTSLDRPNERASSDHAIRRGVAYNGGTARPVGIRPAMPRPEGEYRVTCSRACTPAAHRTFDPRRPQEVQALTYTCLLYTSPSPRD